MRTVSGDDGCSQPLLTAFSARALAKSSLRQHYSKDRRVNDDAKMHKIFWHKTHNLCNDCYAIV